MARPSPNERDVTVTRQATDVSSRLRVASTAIQGLAGSLVGVTAPAHALARRAGGSRTSL
eukprot:1934871-Rhodomonas_salina.1